MDEGRGFGGIHPVNASQQDSIYVAKKQGTVIGRKII